MLAPLATAEEIDVLQAEEAVQVCSSTSSSRSSNRTSSSAWSSEMTAGTAPNNDDDADADEDDAHRLLAIVGKNSSEQFSEIASETNEKELLSKGAHLHLSNSADFGNDIQMLATRLSQMLMSTKGCLPPPPSSSTSSILVDWLRGSSFDSKQNLMEDNKSEEEEEEEELNIGGDKLFFLPMASSITFGRRRKSRHGSSSSGGRATDDVAVVMQNDDEHQLPSGGQLLNSVSQQQQQQQQQQNLLFTTPPSPKTRAANQSFYLSQIARQPMSLQCLKYDSGFGSIFSSSLSTTPFSGSATVATLNNNHNGNSNNHNNHNDNNNNNNNNNNNSTVNLPLPPPPPYRRISLPSSRPLRIYRSYSDSKHRNCRRFDGYHYSPCCGWSAASSRSPSPSMSTVSCPEYGDLQDKLHRLESDRESLSLQVSVLAEQVGAQTEKIKDLESMLEDKKTKLDSTEEMLHEELVTRSSLETNKLDLMAEISNLKLKMAALEREKYEREQQLKTAKNEIAQLQKIVRERQDELDNNAHLPSSAFDANDISRLVRKLRTRTDEVDKLRLAVQNLLTKNVEKEHQIEHLQKCIDLETIRNFQNRSSSRTDHFCSSVPRSLSSTRACDFYSNQEMDFNDHLRKLLLNDSQAKHSSSAQENFLFDDCCYRSGMAMTMMNANNNNNNSNNSCSCEYNNNNNGHSLPNYSINYCSPNLSNMAPVLAPSSPYLSKAVASRGACVGSVGGGSHPSTLAMAANHYAHGQHSGNVVVNNHNDTCYTTARQLAAELDQLAVNFPRPTLDSIYQTGSLPRQITLGTSKKFENGDTGELKYENSEEYLHLHLQQQQQQQQQQQYRWGLNCLKPLVSHRLKTHGKMYSCSVPNLGRRKSDDEDQSSDGIELNILYNTMQSNLNCCTVTDNDDTTSIRSTARFSEQQPFKRGRKYSSLRNFVSKIKRSTSEEIRLTNDQQSKLKQEVVASSRLGRKAFDIHGTTTMDTRADRLSFLKPPMSAFCKWDVDQLSEWLCELGLSCYITDCRRNVQSGRHLINMNDVEVEKILGMKNPLHRKRLKIALSAIESAGTVVKVAERMDFHQTLRWLDDIGLPQYRESFANYRIDGIMLDELTVDDLLYMHITSALHHASIRRGIQMLRMSGYSLNRLNRKFDPHVVTRGSCASSVQFWTQHCISEWLRSSDLTEFTPNLMCSGIHGALMVLDPTFTAESLAAVLQIPQQKTLLRRHLATQFTNLIGADLIAAKRQFLAQSEMPILSPLLKVKLQKKSGFSLTKKKGKHEIFYESGELVCPIAKASLSSLLQFDQQDKFKKPSARNRPTVSEKLLDKLTSTNV
ncbi:Liprin-beta [Trichinella papuae]|uniref:Liprin-beta n=1 Tax=Trichinella papuae TaxID=268474 RepID=A0A0V1N2P1_9BILA|nr:Liprin-beta [Trichinella papuae]